MKLLPYRCLAVLFLANICSTSQAQFAGHDLPQYPEAWNCQWITHPDIDPAAHDLIHFRNTFTLDKLPERFIIHISADNRYRLFVNGEQVCYGPQMGDMRHWRYESVDLAPYLKQGTNTAAVEVMNWGINRSYGIISFKTALMIQGHSKKEAQLNTGGSSSWKVYHNRAVHEKKVRWIFGQDVVGGFYAANPTDSIVAADFPWGWKTADYDDSDWKKPQWLLSKPKTSAGGGHGWIMQPRTTAMQVNKKEKFGPVVRSSIENLSGDIQFGAEIITIPANSKERILIDQGYVTLGYPKLTVSEGKDALIRVKYSEALYDEKNQKGNRNEIKGKDIKGISDVYLLDGGAYRTFQPVWFRAFRFIQLEIVTGDNPLLINDFYNVYSASPIQTKAKFKTNDPVYQEVWDICWRCMEICAQDNLMSDAYYEQMQYVGDLRPHLMAWSSLTGDISYFKSALEQFNNSRLPDGNITSCYPLKATFVHPTYSLIWIDMLHDLMMRDGDRKLIESYTSEIQEVFDYYESLINDKGLVGKSNYHMFIDWYLPKGGNSRVNKEGNSAILTLNFAYSLQKAAEIMKWLGNDGLAGHYKQEGTMLAKRVRDLCFDSAKGIYADDPEKTFYDQRASILAVLCGAHTESEEEMLMGKLLDPSVKFDSQANLFYYFYLFEAMEKTGFGNFRQVIQPWKEIVDMGMTATPEKRIEQHPRSEAHPWTAHPVHFYFSYVAGIKPSKPGYETVHIAPHPGDLKALDVSYPTKHGDILLEIKLDKKGRVKGCVTLPGKMTGHFTWKGMTIPLNSGDNSISLI